MEYRTFAKMPTPCLPPLANYSILSKNPSPSSPSNGYFFSHVPPSTSPPSAPQWPFHSLSKSPVMVSYFLSPNVLHPPSWLLSFPFSFSSLSCLSLLNTVKEPNILSLTSPFSSAFNLLQMLISFWGLWEFDIYG